MEKEEERKREMGGRRKRLVCERVFPSVIDGI
jgi:hypothetical protein